MKKTDIAYIAGLFDGEGCIMINKTIYRPRTYYQLYVQVNMSSQWIIEYLQFTFGGSVHKYEHSQYYPNAKPQWAWKAYGLAAVEFLKAMMPYLKLKKSQAELGLLFQSKKLSKSDYLREAHPNKRFRTDEELAVEEAQFILMKELKKSEA